MLGFRIEIVPFLKYAILLFNTEEFWLSIPIFPFTFWSLSVGFIVLFFLVPHFHLTVPSHTLW